MVSKWVDVATVYDNYLELTVGTYTEQDTSPGWTVVHVTGKNITTTPLKNLTAVIDLDDDGDAWDVILVDSSGVPIPNQSLKLTFGDVAPGASVKQSLWIDLRKVIANPPPGSFTGIIKAFPSFTVDYNGVKAAKNSVRYTQA